MLNISGVGDWFYDLRQEGSCLERHRHCSAGLEQIKVDEIQQVAVN